MGHAQPASRRVGSVPSSRYSCRGHPFWQLWWLRTGHLGSNFDMLSSRWVELSVRQLLANLQQRRQRLIVCGTQQMLISTSSWHTSC
jgi:hypothetical protein